MSEVPAMESLLDLEIKEGDLVIYAKGDRDTGLYLGVVKKIKKPGLTSRKQSPNSASRQHMTLDTQNLVSLARLFLSTVV